MSVRSMTGFSIISKDEMMPKGLSNTEAYETYKSAVRRDPSDKDGGPPLSALCRALWFWLGRYTKRQMAIHYLGIPEPTLADTVAKDILIARTRARNSMYTTLPDLTAPEIVFISHLFRRLDVSNLAEIPSYGPSFLAVWADAKAKGLSPEDSEEFVWRWANNLPAAWEEEDRSKARKPSKRWGHAEQLREKPAINPNVKERLAQIVIWHQTEDLYVPWETDVDGHRWQVRLNDFPDEPMYTLLIDEALVGDFQEWPPYWDRGEPKPAVKELQVAVGPRAVPDVDAGSLLSRYQNGDFEAVWRDMVALGPDVRKESFEKAAWAVAQETMRRAQHNIELLVARLKQLDYRFLHEELVYRPCTKKEQKALGEMERDGVIIPLSFRAFLEAVGTVDLIGSHPTLNPVDGGRTRRPGGPILSSDPLEFSGHFALELLFDEWEDTISEDRPTVSWEVGGDAEDKTWLGDEERNGCYTVQLPNSAADAVLEGEAHKITFVEYLRLSFRWGGFPGWEKYEVRPEKELAFLREGLLPL
ncbi:MAG TPA: hypothetical protein VGE89_01460 [Bryobacteraceae bacterium]|jgi:hypothetical protein